MKKLKKDLRDYIVPIIIVISYLIVMELILGITCPFKLLFHIDCPGCGLTRAFISFFTGNIKEAFHYNYSFIFWLITILLFIINRYIKPFKTKILSIFFIITCLITVIRYVLIIAFKAPIF